MQQEEVTAEKRAKRAEAFVAPAETAAPTVEEKRRRRHEQEKADNGEGRKKKKRKIAEVDEDQD